MTLTFILEQVVIWALIITGALHTISLRRLDRRMREIERKP